MKKMTRNVLYILALFVLLLNACTGVPTSASGGDSNANDASVTQPVGDGNANDTNSNDANSNEANANDVNSNDDNGDNTNSSSQDIEILGVVESMTETAITINGVTYNIVADVTEFKDVISVGDQVKIHVIINADGTFTIRDVEISAAEDNGNDNANSNSNDDNGNDSNSNDDNSNDSNSNDDNGNDSNSNDDANGNNNENNNDDSGSGSGGGNNNDDGGGDDNDSNDNG